MTTTRRTHGGDGWLLVVSLAALLAFALVMLATA